MGHRSPTLGLVEIDTGVTASKVKYLFDGDKDAKSGDDVVSLDIKVIDLVLKGKQWKKYYKVIEGRYFDIKTCDESLFTTYVKEELYNETLE